MSVGIEINEVSYKYENEEHKALDTIALLIRPNDIFGLLGPNGAGKTTLMSIMTGILKPDQGVVRYGDGERWLEETEIRNIIGYVPQDYAFYQELSPLQNLEYFGAMYNISRKEVKRRSEDLLEVLGLASVANKKVGAFSGGMKRRVNLAIGILHRPKVLFLDEPTVGIDVQSKHAIVAFLKELNKEGMTIVYTSHHLSEAEELCNRIAMIDHGTVIACDDVSSLLKSNNSKDLQSLFLSLTGVSYRD